MTKGAGQDGGRGSTVGGTSAIRTFKSSLKLFGFWIKAQNIYRGRGFQDLAAEVW